MYAKLLRILLFYVSQRRKERVDLNTTQLLAIEYAIVAITLFLAIKCLYLKKDNMNYFMRFVCMLNVYAIVNIPIRYVELHLVTWNRNFVFCLYALSIILMTYTTVYWCLFVLKHINSKLVNSVTKIHICLIPSFAIFPLCVINYWTGWLYVIDEASHYNRGSVFVLQALICYGYLLLLIVGSFVHMIKDKEESSAKKVFFALIPGIIGVILQILFGGSYLIVGIAFTGWIMYVEVCLDRQQAYELSEAVRSINDELTHTNKEIAGNMRTILALSDIYHTMYEVDLENDTFTEIKAIEVVSEFCSKYKSAKECMAELPNALFAAAYVGVMQTLFDPETINECLENTDSYFVDAVGKYSKDWIRTTLLVIERNDEGKVVRVVFTFQEIGEIIEQQKKIEEAKIYEIHAQEMKALFVQTAEALAGAIDAKDRYTHGHSVRVAKYSKHIAELVGMSETDCEKIYFSGLLHDVGKIGIRDAIICKEGKLTDEEYDVIKQHPVAGKEILEKINRLPHLCIGAHYHHERYDGKGYPQGLKGEEIPEIARIIAVADAYDAMTSNRSYRTPLAQQKVREELVKGIGTQFDPVFAEAMIHILDQDTEYKLKDDVHKYDDFFESYTFEKYREQCTEGIQISNCIARISFSYEAIEAEETCEPAIVVFDSLDGKVYSDEANQRKMDYTGFCDISFDGNVSTGQIRDCQVKEYSNTTEALDENKAVIETARYRDHISIKIILAEHIREYTIAMRDRSQFAYASITGRNCVINDFKIHKKEKPIEDGYITRIAPEVSYISGKEEGDLRNLEIAGWREDHSQGVLIDGKLNFSFHTMSLPFSNRLWHCPIGVVFTSENGQVYGPGYRELALIRFDGESWEEDEASSNEMTVSFDDDFIDWENWKKKNRDGIDCVIQVERKNNTVVINGEDGGIHMMNITTITEDIPKLYFAFTGDQVALTTIKIVN